MTAMRTMGLAPVLPADATVTETSKEYVVSLPTPGFARQELEVQLADRTLTIRGDQRQTSTDHGSFKIHERIEESFQLPPDVDTDRLVATYAHGTLEIHVPRLSVRSGVRRVPIVRRRVWNPDAAAS